MLLPAGPARPRFLKRCYSSFTHHFVLVCDRQSLVSQHWAQFGGVGWPEIGPDGSVLLTPYVP